MWNEANVVVGQFVADRPWLPQGALQDLWISFGRATEHKVAPRLIRERTPSVTGVPKLRDPIAYDPLEESANDFLARAKDHVKKTERDWKARGWPLIHAKHKSDAVLRREARRLYRRQVLGQKYDEIADQESKETGEYVDPETVRTSVRRWSRVLGVARRIGAIPRERMHLSAHDGPMPMPCQFCETFSMAPDASYVAWSIGRDTDPVGVCCEQCLERMANLVGDRPVTS